MRTIPRQSSLVFGLSLMPLAGLVAAFLLGGLGANPAEALIRQLGDWTLRFLLITLALRPAQHWLGWRLLRHRRMLGLFAFFYAVLHFAAYAVLDAGLDPGYILDDIAKRPYITVGLVGLALLFALAFTSASGLRRRLGVWWRRLHWAIYPAAALGVMHFFMLTRADYREPAVYAMLLSALLLLRIRPAPGSVQKKPPINGGKGHAEKRVEENRE